MERVKRVKVYVPVILKVTKLKCGDEFCAIELINHNAHEEMDIIETDAINAYESGDYMELGAEEWMMQKLL